MRNVLHVIESWGPGGAETVCVELAAGLDRSRFRSSSVVIHEGWAYDTLAARGLDPTIVRPGRGAMDLRFLTGLARVARERRIHVIQSHLLGANLYCGLVGRMLGIPVFSTFHGTVDIGEDRWAGIKLRLIGACARRVIFVSDALRRSFQERVPIAGSRTAVIHNGIDMELFAPRRSDALRRELGASERTLIIGAVGNIRPAKAYDALVRVAAECRNEDWMFVIAGKDRPPLGDELRALERDLGIEGRVRLLGFREDIAPIINGLDIYLSTSRTEGFSLTTVQAMACAVPVVATRSGGPEEIVTDGVDGLLCRVDDVRGMAAALRGLASDPARRAAIAAAGRNTALARFALSRMVDAYTALYG